MTGNQKNISNKLKIKLGNFQTVLIILFIGVLLNDMILINLGIFYIRTYKLALIISVGYIISRYPLRSFPIPKLNWVNVLASLFLLVQMLSVFYAKHLPFSQKLNYTLVNGSSILFLLYAPVLIRENGNWMNKKINVFAWGFLGINILFFIGQELNIPLFSFAGSGASERLYGLFFERLFTCETLILCVFLLFLNRGLDGWKLYALTGICVILIYLSDSFTGRLASAAFILLVPIKSFKKVALIGVFVGILFKFGWPIVENQFISQADLKRREGRAERYFGDNMLQTNWRLLASIVILDDYVNNPTLLGHGFRENMYLLKPYYPNKDLDSFNSSHTFVSILHDQGIVGFALFILMVLAMISKMLYIVLRLFRNKDPDLNKYLIITLVFCLLFLLRICFYYQAMFLWHYLISIVFLDVYFNYKVKRAK